MNPELKAQTEQSAIPPAPDFRVIFESVPGLYAVVAPDDPAFTVLAASDAFLQATHTSRHEIIGRSLFDVFTPRDPTQTATLQNLRASFERVLATRQQDSMPMQKYDLEALQPGSHVEEHYWSPVNSPVLGSAGEVRYIIHRVEDVTEYVRLKRIESQQGDLSAELRDRAHQVEAELMLRSRQLDESQRRIRERQDFEERLLTSETRFSKAFAEAPIGMVLTTPYGRILDVNQAYLDMLGYTREELATRDSAHFTHPHDIAATREFYASLRESSRRSASIEKRYICKNGQVLWARATATMRRDENGIPAQLIGIIEDITERKRAEEQLRAIFDGTYTHIGLLTPEGLVLETNRSSLEFAGNTRQEVIGRPFWDAPWFASTPGAPEAMRQAVRRAAAGEFVRYETTLKRPSGGFATFDMSLHPIRDDQGEVVLIVPEGRDVTDRKSAELRDAFLVRLDDKTRPLTDPFEIVKTAAKLLSEHLNVNRCAYARVDEENATFTVTGEYNRDAPSVLGHYSLTHFGSEAIRVMRTGTAFVLQDSETDPRVQDAVESYRQAGMRALVCVPLLKRGHVIALMATYQSAPREWKREEVELVRRVANRCWESIERAHITQELREREQRFRFLAESIPQMVWTATPEGMLDYVNGQGSTYFGVPNETLLGAGWLARVHHDDQQKTMERWKRSVETGELYETSFRLERGSDKTWRWHLVRASPLIDAEGRVVQWFGTCTDIEDQKQAEANLRQQWQTFDTALSNIPDFTYVFDLEGRFTYINQALLALWQKSFEEARGKNFFDLEYPPELASRLQRQIQEVIDTRKPIRDFTPFTGPTKETRHYDYIFVPVFDEDGRVKAVAGSTRDITEQNRAAQQIEDDRRRWRELLRQTPAAIAVLRGPEHRFEWVNDDYLRLVNRPAKALIGKTIIEALPEIESQDYVDLLNGVYTTGTPFAGHEQLVLLNLGDGSLKKFYLNFVYLATRDVAGEIDGVFVHATDVTDMVLARKQIEESERQFRTLAETIPHLAWMADETGHVFWYNRRWYEYTGVTFDDMEGWEWQKLHDPAVLPEVLAQWQSGISTGEPFEMLFPLRSSRGEFRSFLTRVEPVKDQAGRVVRWFGTNTDITDQRRTEEKLRRMNRELEEFAYVASHDLQEPLRMVNIYTHLLLKGVDVSNERLKQYGDFVRQGVLRMEALIHDLLTFSRTVHTEEAPAGTADLNASVNEAISVLKNRIDESGAEIKVEPLPEVCGDTAQIAHVFQNVLSNALKYRHPNVRPEIYISVKPDSGAWIVSVRDNGIGFEPQYAERIFGLFKRLHKDDYPGTGLGLAICKRIVERYGGRMWAESQPEQGATFYISLPRADLQT